MRSNILMFGWNRSTPGREMVSAQHFQEFVEYLGAQKRSGQIDSFDAVMLEAHGGQLNGFFLIRGAPAKLTELTASTEWTRHQTRAILHLDGSSVVRGITGEAIDEQMKEWVSAIPK